MKKIYVVGIGSGGKENMTFEAAEALNKSDVICGYTVYVDLVKDFTKGKEVISTGMTKEIDRCKMALDEAAKGKTVAVCCSGDSGVYGMAGLIYQLWENYDEDIEIEVVSGVTAALSGSAVLGAPLTHDFAVISLSDLLTDWEVIEKRLYFASQADFSIVLYNPSSKKRADYLEKACDIMLKFKSPETVCGYVRNIGREGEEYEVMTLRKMRNQKLDMFSTVFIGNSQTKVIRGKMVTPRGYEKRL